MTAPRFIDWNGDGRIDPVDIGTSYAVDRNDEPRSGGGGGGAGGGDDESGCGCLIAVIVVVIVLVIIFH